VTSIPRIASPADAEQALIRAAIKRHALPEFIAPFRDLYRSPVGFTPWNSHLQRCAYYANPKIIQLATSIGDRVQVTVGGLCLEALAEQAPARYLSQELGEALMRTPHPPITEEVLDILPRLHLLLPKGLLLSEDGLPVEALVIKAGQLHAPMSEEEREQTAAAMRRHGELLLIPPELEGQQGVMVAALTATAAYGWAQYLEPEARERHQELDALDGPEEEEVRSLTETVARLAINALLIHRHEPELISTDPAPPRVKGAGFGRQQGRSPLAPTWIGKSFRTERRQGAAGQGGVVERGPVRAHWRRGHWHTVVHGAERKERRLQWFRPVFVQPG
jgi:hypothetical protein